MKLEAIALHKGFHADPATNVLEERMAALEGGVSCDLIRLSVGVEHIDDIIDDLSQAFAAAK